MGKQWQSHCHTDVLKKTLTEFNKILDSISHDDKIGHLFTVSIKFDQIYEKTLLFNETYPPIFQKNKKIDRFERSTLQLMSAMIRDEKKKKFSFSLKNTFNTERKKVISLYAEDLHFLITGAGWLVTYIYAHYTFEQAKFKNEFVIMNQKSRQTAISNVEKDFCKLLNNSNFGIDCRNNIDNSPLQLIYDDFSEIVYIKNYTTKFSNEALKDFFSPPLLREEITQTYDAKIFALNREDPTFEARKKIL